MGFNCGIVGLPNVGKSTLFNAITNPTSAAAANYPFCTTGLFHVAILYPTRATLAATLRRLTQARIQLDGASDHGVSEALYLRDLDENGIELYWDRPPTEWPRAPDGELAMVTQRPDLDALLRAIE